MKRKFADFPNWKNVLEKKYINCYFDNQDFKGNISMLTANKVIEKVTAIRSGKEIVIFDDNFKWLEFYPENNKNIAMIVAFNDKEEIVDWFFDIAENSAVSEEGIPYTDDLYLDIILDTSGNMQLVDEDELKEALDSKIITIEQYDFAYKIANKLIENVDGKIEELSNFTFKYFNLLKEEQDRKDLKK